MHMLHQTPFNGKKTSSGETSMNRSGSHPPHENLHFYHFYPPRGHPFGGGGVYLFWG
jgi:hypothetical protein